MILSFPKWGKGKQNSSGLAEVKLFCDTRCIIEKRIDLALRDMSIAAKLFGGITVLCFAMLICISYLEKRPTTNTGISVISFVVTSK
jgi:hypothetical protein